MLKPNQKRALIFAAVVAAGLIVRYAAGFCYNVPLCVVNGWWYPLEMRLPDGRRVELPAGSLVEEVLPSAGDMLEFESADGKKRYSVKVERTATFMERLRSTPCAVANPGAKGVILLERFPAGEEGVNVNRREVDLITAPFAFFEKVDCRFKPLPVEISASGDFSRISIFDLGDLEAAVTTESAGYSTEANGFVLDRLRYGSASGDLCDYFVNTYALEPDRGMRLIVSILKAKQGDTLALHRILQNLSLFNREPEDVAAEYKTYLDRQPEDPVYRYLYARLLPPEEGDPILEGLVREEPELGWAYAALAVNRVEEERFEEAAALSLKARGLLRDYFVLTAASADLLILTGRFEEVLSLPEAKEWLEYHYLSALLGLERYEEAKQVVDGWIMRLDMGTIADYRVFIEWQKRDFTAVSSLLNDHPNEDEAVLFDVFVALNRDDLDYAEDRLYSIDAAQFMVPALIAVGISMEKAGKGNDARRLYETAFGLVNEVGVLHLGPLLDFLCDRDGPEPVFRQLLRTNQLVDLPWVYAAIGVHHETKGQPEEARNMFGKALATNHYPGPFYHLIKRWAAMKE